MALDGYGLLIGKIAASRPKRPGTPHWLLMMQPGDPKHPPYRVAVNLQDTKENRRSNSAAVASAPRWETN